VLPCRQVDSILNLIGQKLGISQTRCCREIHQREDGKRILKSFYKRVIFNKSL
jgi:hypothetical protein